MDKDPINGCIEFLLYKYSPLPISPFYQSPQSFSFFTFLKISLKLLKLFSFSRAKTIHSPPPVSVFWGVCFSLKSFARKIFWVFFVDWFENMASASVGMIGGNGCVGSSSAWFQIKNRRKKNNHMGRERTRSFRVSSSSSSVMDPYKTLRIQPGASESEVKKAFRQLALQVHINILQFLFRVFFFPFTDWMILVN